MSVFMYIQLFCTNQVSIEISHHSHVYNFSITDYSSQFILLLSLTHTHTTVLLLFWNMSGTTRVSRYQRGKTRKVKTNLDLLEQEMVSGNGICWVICKSAPHPRQPRQHPTTQFFTGRMPFLPPNQQRQSTEGTYYSQCDEINTSQGTSSNLTGFRLLLHLFFHILELQSYLNKSSPKPPCMQASIFGACPKPG